MCYVSLMAPYSSLRALRGTSPTTARARKAQALRALRALQSLRFAPGRYERYGPGPFIEESYGSPMAPFSRALQGLGSFIEAYVSLRAPYEQYEPYRA